MSNQPKIRPYYGLKLISIIFKLLVVLIVIVVLGAMGYISVEALNRAPGETPATEFQWWLPRAGILLGGGGLLAFVLYVISQLIDVQITITDKLREIAAYQLQQNEVLEKVGKISKQTMTDVQKLNRPTHIRPEATEAQK